MWHDAFPARFSHFLALRGAESVDCIQWVFWYVSAESWDASSVSIGSLLQGALTHQCMGTLRPNGTGWRSRATCLHLNGISMGLQTICSTGASTILPFRTCAIRLSAQISALRFASSTQGLPGVDLGQLGQSNNPSKRRAVCFAWR